MDLFISVFVSVQLLLFECCLWLELESTRSLNTCGFDPCWNYMFWALAGDLFKEETLRTLIRLLLQSNLGVLCTCSKPFRVQHEKGPFVFDASFVVCIMFAFNFASSSSVLNTLTFNFGKSKYCFFVFFFLEKMSDKPSQGYPLHFFFPIRDSQCILHDT